MGKIPWRRDRLPTPVFLSFPSGSDNKNPLVMRETWVQSLDWEDPLEEGMATHFSILAWRIPRTEEYFMKRGAWQATIHAVTGLDMTEQLSCTHSSILGASLGGTSGKESTCESGRHKRCRFDLGLGRLPRVGNVYLLLHSCLENFTDRWAWWATVHVTKKSHTWLSTRYSCPSFPMIPHTIFSFKVFITITVKLFCM